MLKKNTRPKTLSNPLKVDVIIPVYNAIDSTISCIESLILHAWENINTIVIMNDNSDKETKLKLMELESHSTIVLVHNEENLGFGGNVNKGFQYAKTDYVLVINSDTVANSNFVLPLIRALDNLPDLSAVNSIYPYKIKNYQSHVSHFDVVKTFSLSGYAFLVRRNVFLDAGGFDSVYGKGYFEDTALGRELNTGGKYTGICVSSLLQHEGSKSFSPELRISLERKNGDIFRKHYPQSVKKVLYITTDYNDTPKAMLEMQNQICSDGGKILVFAKTHPRSVPHTRINFYGLNVFKLLIFLNRTIIRGSRRPHTKTTDIWLDRSLKNNFFYKTFLAMICVKYDVNFYIQ
jgi:GT2 family glycosyltransferase